MGEGVSNCIEHFWRKLFCFILTTAEVIETISGSKIILYIKQKVWENKEMNDKYQEVTSTMYKGAYNNKREHLILSGSGLCTFSTSLMCKACVIDITKSLSISSA